MKLLLVFMFALSATWIYSIDGLAVDRLPCRDDEMFVQCARCGPQTCKEMGTPKRCSAVDRLPCRDDEMFVQCAHCGPQTCKELGTPKPCSGGTGLCKEQCVCIEGYVRDDNGACILKKECPDCGGDRNATSGCGFHCGRSCSDYKDLNKDCSHSCQYNRCDCKDGYVFHDKLGVCVSPEDC